MCNGCLCPQYEGKMELEELVLASRTLSTMVVRGVAMAAETAE